MSIPTAPPTSLPEPQVPSVIRLRSWPLYDGLPTSLLVPITAVLFSGLIGYACYSWLTAAIVLLAVTWTMGSYMLPVEYEMNALGYRRTLWFRTDFVPWRSIRSYQPRSSGLVLFNQSAPAPIDILRARFLPYGDDPDEALCAARYHLRHVEELAG